MTPADHYLHAHPSTACPAVRRLHVRLDAPPGHGVLRLRYHLTADLAALQLPPASAQPQATDDLWRHTCFEAFVAAEGAAGYHEFNFSPSGDWAAYVFSAERVRDAQASALPAPRIACTPDGDALTLEAWLPLAALPASNAGHRLGLSAVIQTQGGLLSFWALHHPAAQPDFHHRAGWTARLPDNRRP